jgi:OmcA/MtrC family decaheme c-type cytochrome
VACGSCHDNVNFNTGKNHVNLPQATDDGCAQCHVPGGETPFDISINGAHTLPRFTPGLVGVVFTLENVEDGIAGGHPAVTFTIKSANGSPIDIRLMNSLNLVIAGPASNHGFVAIEDGRNATGRNGTYVYTFQTAIPLSARGTYTIGIEGYRNAVLLPGTGKQQIFKDAGYNRTIDFSVENRLVEPRNSGVTEEQCNRCHYALAAHEGIRQNVQYCVLCHTGQETKEERGSDEATRATDMAVLIHRIHGRSSTAAGEQKEQDFKGYPADPRDCSMCHINGSQELPILSGSRDSTPQRGEADPAEPAWVACWGCHGKKSASAHGHMNDSGNCGACHGSGADFAVDKVHSR